MVATIGAITSSAAASSYYEADDYYADGGLSPSEWQGEGAKALGLEGEVERDAFRDMLDGKLPYGQQLGTVRDGKLEHRPGWDVTMSAPKSVSIMAEVAGDRRLVGAHDRAVKTALAFAERHAAATRIRTDGIVERHQTGNLAIASFRHDTSRAQDPQLGLGKVSAAQIGAAIVRSNRDGELVPRTFLDRRGAEFAGFTTATNIANERCLLRAESEGRGSVKPMLSPAQASKAVARAVLQSEHRWNPGQREATKALLTSSNRVTALQGYAGTAKTTTVLATLASEATARGLRVTPLAPTASAARTLGDALDMKGETVAKHLMGQTRLQRGGVWIVDEASMLSARDMAALLDRAGKGFALSFPKPE